MKNHNDIIRIANIIEESRIGGPQRRVIAVASALAKKIDITIIFPKTNSKEIQEECKSYGIKNLPLSLSILKKNWIKIIIYFFWFPLEVIKLTRILKKNKYDIVHVSGGCWQTKGIFAAKLASVKVVWELNDTYTPAIIRGIFSLLSPLADSFIFASQRSKDYYKKLIPPERKSFLIQSPVDINFFDPNLNYPVEDFIDKILRDKKIIIGTVANVNPVKGLTSFIETAKKLSIYSNKIIFIVIGSIYDSQRDYYKNLLNMMSNFGIDNFFFMNSRKDVRPLLKAIDIYVCCSFNESSPLSVWEAMSMEKAIVSNDVGDIGSFIKNNFSGILVDVGDTDRLAEGIKKLIESPKLRNKFGKEARKIALKNLNLEICALLHEETYKSILYNDN